MKILYVSEFYPPVVGGLEIHVAALARAMQRQGHEVFVATLATDANPTIQNEDGIEVHRIASLLARTRSGHTRADRPFHPPLPDPLVRRSLRAILEKTRPDIIHAHNWMGISLPRVRPPLFYTSHDYSLICPKRTLLRANLNLCGGPTPTSCLPCSSQQYGLGRAALIDGATRIGRTIFSPDYYLAVSNSVAEAISPYIGTMPRVVNNFLPQRSNESRSNTTTQLPSDRFALFAGVPGKHKGFDILLQAWQDPPCHLVIASIDESSSQQGAMVTCLSAPPEEMPSIWDRAYIAVVPSIWAEPCPTVVIEALAHGVPVVASRVGGIPELVRDRVEGLLVQRGNASELRAAVCELLRDQNLYATLRRNALARAELYRADRVATQLLRL